MSLESLKAALAQWLVLPEGAADSPLSDASQESTDPATKAPAVDLARLSEVLGTDDADTTIEILQLFSQHQNVDIVKHAFVKVPADVMTGSK